MATAWRKVKHDATLDLRDHQEPLADYGEETATLLCSRFAYE